MGRHLVPHECPTCGQVRMVRKTDHSKIKCCRRCHCKRIGRLGFAASAARHGRDYAIRAAANRRRAHPSTLEAKVAEALTHLAGVKWQREAEIPRINHLPYFVDFAITLTCRIALEVDGTYVHQQRVPNPDREMTLRELFDRVVVITEAEIQDAADLVQLVKHKLFE